MMIAVTALGMGALLMASEIAFTVVKFLGAAYLVWLGIRILRSEAELPAENPEFGRYGVRGFIRQEFLVAIGNPKTILIFTAFFPQFVDATNYWGSFMILGAIFPCSGNAGNRPLCLCRNPAFRADAECAWPALDQPRQRQHHDCIRCASRSSKATDRLGLFLLFRPARHALASAFSCASAILARSSLRLRKVACASASNRSRLGLLSSSKP